MPYYDIEYFHKERDSLQVLGDQDFRELLANTIYVIPKDVLDDVLSNCAFLMLNEENAVAAAFIPKKLIEGKSILAFYNILYEKEKGAQGHMIFHEIAHYVLDHIDEGLSDEDYYNQEREANKLVDKWIKDWQEYFHELQYSLDY